VSSVTRRCKVIALLCVDYGTMPMGHVEKQEREMEVEMEFGNGNRN